MPTIGQLLKEARNRAGLSQKEAAKKAKLSAPTLCVIESAEDVYWSTVVKLCKVYGVTVPDLLNNNQESRRTRK